MNKYKVGDLIGQHFGMLTVVEKAEGKFYNNKEYKQWLCRCDCGKEKVIMQTNLMSGRSTNCGCQRILKIQKATKTHGMTNSRLYVLYKGILARCYNKNHQHYKEYGGRGIGVCSEWLEDFMNFYNWAIANGYDKNAPRGKCTLDRINNDGNYEPSNCRWVDMNMQANNTRKNVMVEIDGKKLSLSQWAKMYGMKYSCLYSRWCKGVRGNDLFKGYHLLEQIRGNA